MYSHSRLSTFEQCKLKFKFKYIDKVKVDIKDTIETFLGSRVHETLEKLYKDLNFEKKNTKEELLLYLETIWKEKWHDEILIVRDEYKPENYFEMAKRFVSDYYDKYQPFDQAKVIGTEIYIKIKLDSEGKYQLQGYIDRLDSKGDYFEVHDYKTSNTLPLQEYLDKDRQLALYSIAIREQYNAKDVRLVWHYLNFNKEVESKRTPDELEKLKQDIITLIKEIESCTDFSPTTSALCDWCEFKKICPEFKHLYKEDDVEGTAAVDEYASLKEEESKIQKKLEELKEKILLKAEQENVSALFGTNKKVKIWSKDFEKFPATADPSFEEFNNTIKMLGLWDEFSRIDSFKLEREFQKLPPTIKEELLRFARKQKVTRLYLGNK